MLTTTNRGGIITSLKQWSQRKNIPDDVLSDFVEIALSRATRALRIPPLEEYQLLPITEAGYAELPSDFQEAKEVYVQIEGKNVILERKYISEIDWNANLTGDPCFFGRFGNALRIAPWQGGADQYLHLYYYKIIPPMTTPDTENWFTLYAPEVLLYGALAEMCNYTRDMDGIVMWSGKFTEAVNILQSVEDRAEWRGSTVSVSLKGSTPR